MSANFRNPNFLLPNEVNMATNPALSEDRHSLYSMEFDGSSFIDVGNDVSVSGDCTVSLWFKVPAIPDSTGEVMFARYTGSSDTDFLIIGLYRQGVLASNNSNSSGSKITKANVTLAADTWYHCAVTKVSGVVTNIYIDGTDRAGSVATYEWWSAGSTDSGFIGQKANSDTLFDGKIDEVAIFNTALTENEVQALSTANAPANIMALNKKPIAYYPLGEQARDNTNWQFPNEVLQSQVFDFTSNGYIELPTVPTLNMAGASKYSTNIWINRDSTAQEGILGYNYSNGRGSGWYLWCNGTTFIAQLGFSGGSSNFGTWNYTVPSADFIGSWHMITMVFDGSQTGQDRLKVYYDGEEPSGATYNNPSSFPSVLPNGIVGDNTRNVYLGVLQTGTDPSAGLTLNFGKTP